MAGGPYNYDPFSTLSRNTKDQKQDFTASPGWGAPHFRTEAWKIEKKTPKCRKRLQPKSHLTARAPTQHHQCGKNDQVPPQGGQMWPKASQKPPKVTPKWSLFVPKCVFGKLRLDCACVGRSHVGPCRGAARDTPKRHPPESITKMPAKIDFGRAFGGQWARWGAHGTPMGANGLQNASQTRPKFIENWTHPSSLPPQTTKTTNWRPKGSKIEGRPAFKSPAHVEKLAIVAAFTGQDRRCVRGPRGKIRDSGPLTHSLHRKSSRKHCFCFSSPWLSGAGVLAGFPAGLLQLPARLQTQRPAPQCRIPKARWRFGPLAL